MKIRKLRLTQEYCDKRQLIDKNMLDSFDKFLADAATAFKDTDAKLAEEIGDRRQRQIRTSKTVMLIRN